MYRDTLTIFAIMKRILSILILLAGVVLVFIVLKKHTPVLEAKEITKKNEQSSAFLYLKGKADSAKLFCKKNNYHTNYCILIDFKIHSGKNRIFVWDFNADTVLYSGLCAHGYGKGSTYTKPVFSNEPGSYCSSTGKYKIGAQYVSIWGIKIGYKLHGLENTNNNAYARNVVLHSYENIAEEEISPEHIPLGYSQGCPVVSNQMMTNIHNLLKAAEKPVLLWIYY